MATKLYNLARMYTTTTDTGTLALVGAVAPFLTFVQAGVQDGDQVIYSINDFVGGNVEEGLGTYSTAGNTLSRDTVYRSSGAGNTGRVTLSGRAEVCISLAKEFFGPLDAVHGGTGQGAYAIGDLLYASATTALSKLAAVAVGSILFSQGVNTAPVWSPTPSLTSLTAPLLIGGTAAGSSLSLRATSGVGIGAEFIDFALGNNGAIQGMRLINLSGLFPTLGIGKTPQATNPQLQGLWVEGMLNLTYQNTNLPLSDGGGIHIGMPFAKDEAYSGNFGGIKIFSNNINSPEAYLQATIKCVTDPTAGNRRLSIECIEQGTAYRNVTLNELGGNVGIGTSTPTSTLYVSGTCTITGTATHLGSIFGTNLILSANATVGGTLGVTGDTSLAGNFTINTNKFKVTASNGETVAAGSFQSTGTVITLGANRAILDYSASSVASRLMAFGADNSTRGTLLLHTFSADASLGATAALTINSSGNTSVAGALGVTGATTLSAALTYGGVTLSNAVTGTGNMVLSASPTFTGVLTHAAGAVGAPSINFGTGNTGIYSAASATEIDMTIGGTLRWALTGTNGGVTQSGWQWIGATTAIPAGGSALVGYFATTTGTMGIYFGAGTPTVSAAKGSIYLRSDGSTTNDRMYVNTNGTTTWTAVTTVA